MHLPLWLKCRIRLQLKKKIMLKGTFLPKNPIHFFFVSQPNILPIPKYGILQQWCLWLANYLGFFSFVQLLVQDDSLSTAINLAYPAYIYMSFFKHLKLKNSDFSLHTFLTLGALLLARSFKGRSSTNIWKFT